VKNILPLVSTNTSSTFDRRVASPSSSNRLAAAYRGSHPSASRAVPLKILNASRNVRSTCAMSRIEALASAPACRDASIPALRFHPVRSLRCRPGVVRAVRQTN
jgi:hypothetical protein